MHYELKYENYFGYVGDKVDENLQDLIDAYNYANEAPTMTSTDAIYHAEMMIADAALEIFIEGYDKSYEIVDALSDGEMGDEYIAYMAKVEHELMVKAFEVRQKRLDATNRLIGKKQVGLGE